MEKNSSSNRRRRRLDSLLRFSKKRGYESVIERGAWRGYDVYEMVLSGKEVYVGIPQYIVVEGDKMRLTTPDEAFEIMDAIGNAN